MWIRLNFLDRDTSHQNQTDPVPILHSRRIPRGEKEGAFAVKSSADSAAIAHHFDASLLSLFIRLSRNSSPAFRLCQAHRDAVMGVIGSCCWLRRT
ncbi:MAG: hypothetical protein KGL75_01460, partial [Acidobacteriota bacterium]|nr:hypothetical protein [Acidobacteriota bacterium]